MRKIGLLGRQLVAPMLLALGAGVANAAVVTYDEDDSGDLSGSPQTTFAFDVGANTVSGNTGYSVVVTEDGLTTITIDSDGFKFTVPTGTQVVGAQVFMAQAVDSGTLQVGWFLFSELDVNTQLGHFLITSTNSTVALPSPSFGPGTYLVYPSSVASIGGQARDADYTFTFTLRDVDQNQVPEPATPLLLAGALLVAAAVGRRARR